MKRIYSFIAVAAIGLALALPVMANSDEKSETKTGDTTVIAYEGSQQWPTTTNAVNTIKEYAVPIYKGLPDKGYKVIGRIVDDRQEGVEVVGRAFDDTFGSQKLRLRNCANQAKLHGGDAVLITDDERVLKALSLTTKDAKKETPLSHERKNVVLIIKF